MGGGAPYDRRGTQDDLSGRSGEFFWSLFHMPHLHILATPKQNRNITVNYLVEQSLMVESRNPTRIHRWGQYDCLAIQSLPYNL